MRVEKKHFFDSSEINLFNESLLGEKADLVFYFGERELIGESRTHEILKKLYPNSIILGCSTGGEIARDEVYEDTIVSLAIDFEKTQIKQASAKIHKPEDSFAAGQKIASELNSKDLRGIFLLSDGLCVNGSSLVNGIRANIAESIPIMGGLAGDGKNFTKTLVGGVKEPDERVVVAVGFYGDAIQFGHGSSGGWDIFGPERKITKSKGNILYEVDGKPFLDVYKS